MRLLLAEINYPIIDPKKIAIDVQNNVSIASYYMMLKVKLPDRPLLIRTYALHYGR